jgi:hypothetical protein
MKQTYHVRGAMIEMSYSIVAAVSAKPAVKHTLTYTEDNIIIHEMCVATTDDDARRWGDNPQVFNGQRVYFFIFIIMV